MGKNRVGFGPCEKRLFLLCWTAYFATYICRLNFSAVMPELNTLGLFTKAQMASVSSCFLLHTAWASLSTAFWATGSRRARWCSAGCWFRACAISCCFCARLRGAAVFWGMNGFVQSMVWSPILRLAGEYYDEKGKSKFGIDISTTVPLGTLASYGVSMLALKFLPWNGVFLVCGLIVLAVSLVWFFGTGWLLPKMERVAPPPAAQMARASGEKLPLRQFLSLFASSGLILLLIPIAVHGTLKDSVTQWVPTYIVETFAADSSISLLLTMILPIVNVAGAYLAKWLNRYTRSEPATASVFLPLRWGF